MDQSELIIKTKLPCPLDTERWLGNYILRDACKHNTWHEEQRLSFNAFYESSRPVVLPVDKTCSQSLGISFSSDCARQERERQNDLTLNVAFSALLKDNRAYDLLHLFVPPEFLCQTGGLPFDFQSKWFNFVEEVRYATAQDISKQEAILTANLSASETVIDDSVYCDLIEVSKNGGCIESLILHKRAQVSRDGLCRESIIRTLRENYPDLEDLYELVEKGAILEPGEAFVKNNVPEEPRELEKKLGKQTLKQYLKLWKESKGIILDSRVFSPDGYKKLHWIVNQCKPKPRSNTLFIDIFVFTRD